MILGADREVTGVVVAVCSAGLYDVGYVLEKQALGGLPAVNLHPVRLLSNVLQSRRWIAGFLIMIVGLGLQVTAFTLAPVSVVQPILAGGLIGLAALAGPVLGERLGRRQLAALALVLASVLCIALSTRSSTSIAARAPVGRFAELAVPIAIVGALFAVAGHGRRRVVGHRALLASALSAGLLYGLGAVAEKAVATRMVAKGVLPGAWAALGTPYPWLFLLATVAGMAAFQVGLQRHPASIMATFTNVAAAVCALIGASVVFGERLLPTGAWAGARLAGFAAVALAVAVLVAQPAPQEAAAASR
jgi:drug/metabolite transporter (DMT)-like permease